MIPLCTYLFCSNYLTKVELAKNLGDVNLDRPWSKYSEKSSAFQKKQKAKEEKESTDDKKPTATQVRKKCYGMIATQTDN